MPGMKPLPLPEVLNLLEKLPPKYQAICAIGVTTGCRISEILALRRFDLLQKNGKIKDKIAFIVLKKKKNAHRKFSVPEAYQPYLIRHLIREENRGYDRPDDLIFRGHHGKPLSRLTVYHIFKEKLGDGYGTHWMRKTFAKEMFNHFLKQNSTDPMRALELTRRALDHARIDTTIRYLGITEESIDNAQKAVFTIPAKPSP